MPFDGSGNFNRVMNWVSDELANIKIVANRHDSEDDNFASGLSNCITKDGQTQPTANIPMNGKRLLNLGNPTTGTDGANRSYVDTGDAAVTSAFGAADALLAPKANPTFTGKVTLPTGHGKPDLAGRWRCLARCHDGPLAIPADLVDHHLRRARTGQHLVGGPDIFRNSCRAGWVVAFRLYPPRCGRNVGRIASVHGKQACRGRCRRERHGVVWHDRCGNGRRQSRLGRKPEGDAWRKSGLRHPVKRQGRHAA
jgi:hypothetical protein